MIYWYTGQPGHGKTLHAIERLLEFKAKGRRVFACNIRKFDYEKAGVEPLTPEQFRDWMTVLPDGAVVLVDEAYEHDMLPKRAPGAKVPAHVEQLAKHRHRGLDFIFVCQSPDKQCDVFTHDLIERHIHVRRRFGTSFVHLREFDRYERNPEKGHPLVLRRGKLPKKVFGLYESTEMDTTERKVPWYFIAFVISVPTALGLMYWTFSGLGDRLGSGAPSASEPIQGVAPYQPGAKGATEPSGDGATAREPMTLEQYVQQFVPRIPSQPWSAPVYDGKLSVSNDPPRIFCMASGAGLDANGAHREKGCSCVTEQGTSYALEYEMCATIASKGQYEPFYNERDSRLTNGNDQQRRLLDSMVNRRSSSGFALAESDSASVLGVGDPSFRAQQARYGQMRTDPIPADYEGSSIQ